MGHRAFGVFVGAFWLRPRRTIAWGCGANQPAHFALGSSGLFTISFPPRASIRALAPGIAPAFFVLASRCTAARSFQVSQLNTLLVTRLQVMIEAMISGYGPRLPALGRICRREMKSGPLCAAARARQLPSRSAWPRAGQCCVTPILARRLSPSRRCAVASASRERKLLSIMLSGFAIRRRGGGHVLAHSIPRAFPIYAWSAWSSRGCAGSTA